MTSKLKKTIPPKTDDDTAKLLRILAGSKEAQRYEHDVIFNEAARRCEYVHQLKLAVLDYLAELDNPVPDYLYRANLANNLRTLVGAPAAPTKPKRI